MIRTKPKKDALVKFLTTKERKNFYIEIATSKNMNLTEFMERAGDAYANRLKPREKVS